MQENISELKKESARLMWCNVNSKLMNAYRILCSYCDNAPLNRKVGYRAKKIALQLYDIIHDETGKLYDYLK